MTDNSLLDDPGHPDVYVMDLYKDPVHRFFRTIQCVIPLVLAASLYPLGEWWGGVGMSWLVWGFFVRTGGDLQFHHFVNSATHKWGYRNFETRDVFQESLVGWQSCRSAKVGITTTMLIRRSARHACAGGNSTPLMWYQADELHGAGPTHSRSWRGLATGEQTVRALHPTLRNWLRTRNALATATGEPMTGTPEWCIRFLIWCGEYGNDAAGGTLSGTPLGVAGTRWPTPSDYLSGVPPSRRKRFKAKLENALVVNYVSW